MTEVVIRNLRKTTNGFRYDRTSILGNPFHMRNETERDAVCDAYEEYFNTYINSLNGNASVIAFELAQKYNVKIATSWKRPPASSVFKHLADQARKVYQTGDREVMPLLCWCAPKRCHCETIKRYIEQA